MLLNATILENVDESSTYSTLKKILLMVPVYGTENKNWFYVLIINILFIWKLQLPEENIYGKYVTKGDELSNCFSSWLNSQNLTS